jgi:hypothetical protein
MKWWSALVMIKEWKFLDLHMKFEVICFYEVGGSSKSGIRRWHGLASSAL